MTLLWRLWCALAGHVDQPGSMVRLNSGRVVTYSHICQRCRRERWEGR